MLVVIDYDTRKSKSIGECLQLIGANYSVTLNETEILCADGLILLDCCELKHSLRKIQLSNLNNALRLYKKPILGINSGLTIIELLEN